MPDYGLHVPLETVLGLIPGTPWNKERKLNLEMLAAQSALAKLMPSLKERELGLEEAKNRLLERQLGLTGRGQIFDLIKTFGGPLWENILEGPYKKRQLDISESAVRANRLGHWLDFGGKLLPTLWSNKEPNPLLYSLYSDLATAKELNPNQQALMNRLGQVLGIQVQPNTQATPQIGPVDEAAKQVTSQGWLSRLFEGLFKKQIPTPTVSPMKLLNPFL